MVKGMEKVVATVSGYHGSQRSKLIKLITDAGANYVGKMSKSITHLVCWKFKGEKYELARKFGTLVVNHRWFEDCIKEKKRLPESPYAQQSGEEAGFVNDLPVDRRRASQLVENKLILNKLNVHDHLNNVIDLDSDEIENDVSDDGWLLDENLFPKPGSTKTARQRFKRKVVKEAIKEKRQRKTNIRRSMHEPECEEPDYLPNFSFKQRTRDDELSMWTDLAETSRRSRRLVRKNARSDVSELATDDFEPQRITGANIINRPTASSVSNDSNDLMEEVQASISKRPETTSAGHDNSRPEVNHRNDVCSLGDTILHQDDEADDKGRNSHEISPKFQNVNGQHEDRNLVDHSTTRHTVELSCVICWTEFSSTRGVLPCGHRFCFSCIQNWADHMASNRKETTCPLCKASFASITRVEGAASLDQKIYSQTIPLASSSQDIFIVPEVGAVRSATQVPLPSVCCHCQSPYPADLLIHCQICQTSCIHSYCLDPPLFPWTCISCRGRRLF